jgi:hypothetical protein
LFRARCRVGAVRILELLDTRGLADAAVAAE